MKLIIFDLDGTLVNSRAQILRSFSEAFTDLGLPQLEEERVLSIVGLSLLIACEKLVGKGENAERLAKHYRDNHLRIHSEIGAQGPQLYSGIQEVIASLQTKPDIVLGIATGNSQKGVQRILETNGWQNVFATIQTADDSPSKPNPGMILQAMVDTGILAEQTLMVGDTSYDIEMAVAAGVDSIGVTWGNHPEETLRRSGATYIVHDRQAMADICLKF